MKKYLALIAAVGMPVCHAASPAGERASDLRQVTAQRPAAPPSSTPRRLSDNERAELRRQLSQYGRLPGGGKGS
jgi:hypothetical protein